jgi:chloride channel 3/4/5
MSAACAAGVAVAFAAPIGGVLFSLEEVSYYFPPKTMWRAFFCALIGTVTLQIIDPFGTGKLVLFQVTYNKPWFWYEIIGFFLLGIIGGCFGAAFIAMTDFTEKQKAKLEFKFMGIYHVMIVSILTCLLSFGSEITRMSNVVLVSHLYSDCENDKDSVLCAIKEFPMKMKLLGFSFFVKATLMVITYGIRVPGGIFLPGMVVGAILGRIIGEITLFFVSDKVIPGVYAMVGAAAVLGGTTRMTVSLIVTMVEVTGSLTYVLPLMIAVMVSKWTADAFGRHSIYDAAIEHKGYPYLNHKHTSMTQQMTAKDMMEQDGQVIDCDYIYRKVDLEQKVAAMEIRHPALDGGFPVVKNGFLMGYISQGDLKHALDNEEMDGPSTIQFLNVMNESESDFRIVTDSVRDFTEYVDRAPTVVSVSASGEMIIEYFVKLGVKTILVVKRGQFAGVIHKKTLLSFL